MAVSYWGGAVGFGCVRPGFSRSRCLRWLVRYFIGLMGSMDFWFNPHSIAVFMWGSDRPRWAFSRRRIAALMPPSRLLVVR